MSEYDVHERAEVVDLHELGQAHPHAAEGGVLLRGSHLRKGQDRGEEADEDDLQVLKLLHLFRREKSSGI